MNCQKAGDLLSAYIEGEVTGRESEALEAHLGHCASCCEELETLHSAIALLEAPKAMVRPEGLLEEFKEKYLPEADAAPAPRWGIRLPVIPRFEWPSLSQMLLPMGGLAAAGAAAALVVALHSQPVVGPVGPGGPTHGATHIAVLPSQTDPAPNVVAAPKLVPTGTTAPENHATPDRTTGPKPIAREYLPTRRHPVHLAEGFTVHRHRRAQRHLGEEPSRQPVRHRGQRPAGYAVAQLHNVPAANAEALETLAPPHEQAVPSPEAQWQDQVVAIRRPAAVAPADDGSVEATSTDLATGKQDRFASDSTAAEPAAGGKSGADK